MWCAGPLASQEAGARSALDFRGLLGSQGTPLLEPSRGLAGEPRALSWSSLRVPGKCATSRCLFASFSHYLGIENFPPQLSAMLQLQVDHGRPWASGHAGEDPEKKATC